MNIDDELRRLFADDRLELHTAPGADQTVLAGVRRIRRRRAAMAIGAVVLAVIAVAGGAAATVDRRESLPPAQSSPTTSVAEPKTLGPLGYGALRLGMTWEEALASGEIIRPPNPPQEDRCTPLGLRDNPAGYSTSPPRGDATLAWEAGQPSQVWRIGAWPGVRTPEGIGIGSTSTEVRAAYPDAGPQLDSDDLQTRLIISVEVPGGDANARYGIGFGFYEQDRVELIELIDRPWGSALPGVCVS